jgi:L-2-hydroxyglutarate oxidase
VARKYWKTGLGEYYRSFSKKAFTKALQRMVPEVREDDLMPGGAGVRAQASERNGALMDDFSFVEHGPVLHVCNAPSPAATASLAIGDVIANRVAGAQ